MTRANRERAKRRKQEIVISKCMYEINPFPDQFEPEKHNKYLRARKLLEANQNAEMQSHQLVRQRLAELQGEKVTDQFSWCTLITETIIMVSSLSFVPTLMIVVLWTWPV